MKNMKRIAALLLAAVFCVICLASCGDKPAGDEKGSETPKAPVTFDAVWNAVRDTVPDADKLVDVQDTYLKNFIKADPENFAAFKVVVQSISSSIDEVGIFEARSADEVASVKEMVENYLSFYQNEIWDGRYNQEEFPKLRDAECVVSGNFVMYIITDDATRASAVSAFENITK